MPFVNVKTARGLLDDDQKARLCERITEVVVEIEGHGDPAFRDLVWVLVEEHEPGAWCLGGNRVTQQMVDALAGRSARVSASGPASAAG